MNNTDNQKKDVNTKDSKKKRARSKIAKENIIKDIINAGKKEFLMHGSEKATMRNIANIVNMSVGNLYTYFSSKQELWNAIINEYFNQFTKELMKILSISNQSPFEIFDNIAKMFFSFATSDPDRFKMMFFIPPPRSKTPNSPYNPIDLTFIDLIRRILKSAIDSGELKEDKVDFYANLFGAIGIGSILMISPELGNFGGGFNSKHEKKEFLEFVRNKLPLFFK